MGVGVQKTRLGRFTPEKQTRHPLYIGIVGPEDWSGRVPKISPSPGFDPCTYRRTRNESLCRLNYYQYYTTDYVEITVKRRLEGDEQKLIP